VSVGQGPQPRRQFRKGSLLCASMPISDPFTSGVALMVAGTFTVPSNRAPGSFNLSSPPPHRHLHRGRRYLQQIASQNSASLDVRGVELTSSGLGDSDDVAGFTSVPTTVRGGHAASTRCVVARPGAAVAPPGTLPGPPAGSDEGALGRAGWRNPEQGWYRRPNPAGLPRSNGDRMSSNTMRFEKLLEAVPDALVGMDQKGVIRFVNRQSESLFGYERDQLIGEPIGTVVPEPLWQIYAEHEKDYFSDPRTRSSGLDLQLRGRDHDGTEFPINISMSHIDTDDVLLVITAVGDVTRQRQAVDNAALVEAIVEYSDDAISASTLEGTITSWNPAAARMYGYTSKEIIGRSGSILTPEDRAGDMGAVLAKIRVGQTIRHFRTTRVRKDGTVFPISLSVAPIRDAAGAIVGAAGVFRDVTEQRQVFEALKRMASIVEDCADAIIGKTLDGIITSWNPAAEELFGYSRQDVIGTSSTLLNLDGGSDQTKAILTKIAAGQPVAHLQSKGVRKNGTVFAASVTISPIRDAGGAVVGASVIAREVTGQK
jgi:PAS domain S-box-containing protein